MSLDVYRWGTDDPKRQVAAAIDQAQADLERAMRELERMPALDVHALALAAHALTSFLAVTGAVVEMLIPVLRDHPDRQVRTWLDGLAHATALMRHTVSQLMNRSVGVPTTLHLEDVDTAALVERACAYYRRLAEPRGIVVRCSAGAGVPSIHTDRVLLAAVLDSLLSHALGQARARTEVTVDVREEAEGVACDVRHDAPPAAAGPAMAYGLEVAKRFVELLGGRLTSDDGSHGDDAATISLWLPRGRPGA